MLSVMVDLNPDKRPSAKDLLSSDLYLDKDQVCCLRFISLVSPFAYV